MNELDFFWSQIAKKTIQRVQSGSQVLRQGFFNIQYENSDINMEWVGSTFTQGFYSRLERLYPGTESIFIINDVIAQNFVFSPLKDLLGDLLKVNKRSLTKMYLLWLEPYVNSPNQFDQYKIEIKTELKEFLELKNISIEILDFNLPLYSTERFIAQVELIYANLIDSQLIAEYIKNKLPLRPLFRSQRPFLDPNAPKRVIILDLEKSSDSEPIRKIKNNLDEKFESQKCLACALEVSDNYNVCITCKFVFCNRCADLIKEENGTDDIFCLGSIYHGLHRTTYF